MFFKKKCTDCSAIIDENHSLIGLPIQSRIWNKTSEFSYPEHPDTDITKRIDLQKLIIEEFGVIEIIFTLSTAAEDFQKNFKPVRKLAIPCPVWHAPSNFKAAGSTFTLYGDSYLAEQHSSNYRSHILLAKNGHPILTAYISPTSPSHVSILGAKLDKNDVQRLAVVANVINVKRRVNHDTWVTTMIDRLKTERDEDIKRNF